MTANNNYIEVTITTGNNSERKDMLVAQLAEAGFEGFEEERHLLKAFIPEREFDESQLSAITETHGVAYTKSIIEHKNWNEVWEAEFEPVIVEDFCGIRAHFHPPLQGVEYEIIITPKMSFGTGHHATTYLVIKAMKDIDIKGKSVFDFGTGTGVLAILAEKMGASEIEAVDIDDWSIENGKENLVRNQAERVHLYKADNIPGGMYDVLLANINRNIILQHLGSMQSHIKPGGTLVLSGLLAGDEEVVTQAALQFSLKFLAKEERNSWIALKFVNDLH